MYVHGFMIISLSQAPCELEDNKVVTKSLVRPWEDLGSIHPKSIPNPESILNFLGKL